MRSFLDRFRLLLCKRAPDAEIVGDVKFRENKIPYFMVKMQGCGTLVDINAEDICEKFTTKFHQQDIKNATKVFMSYRNISRIVALEKNLAILFDHSNKEYQSIDLSDNFLLQNFDIDVISASDAFLLGTYFERIRVEKDKALLNVAKIRSNITYLKVIKSNE